MENDFDISIIGGGIVGLATAYRLHEQFPQYRMALIEKEDRVAAHQTGHNSGVIHSGLYYKPGTSKAVLAVKGAEMLKQFCTDHHIPFRLCGKVVVAADERELPALEELHRRGQANGVRDLKLIDRAELKEIEPHAAGIKALRVPHAGIVDYTQVSQKMAEILAKSGIRLFFRNKVQNISGSSGRWNLHTDQSDIRARFVISCAGLHSDRVASMTVRKTGFRIVSFRGEYYKLRPERAHLVKGLIYPVPDPRFPFLGVHFTNLIQGGVEAGPNAVLAFHREGYQKRDFDLRDTLNTWTYPGFIRLARKFWRTGIDEMKRSYSKKLFVHALQKLVPEIQVNDLAPGGSGVRAQALRPDGNLVDDFLILEDRGAMHVCNAPSPAATASLAIAETIVQKARIRFELP